MKIEWNKKYFLISIYFFLTLAACISFYLAISHFSLIWQNLSFLMGLLMPFVYGFVIAYILNPILVSLDKKVLPYLAADSWNPAFRRIVSVLLTYMVAVVIFILFLSIVMPQIVTSVFHLALKIPSYVKNFEVMAKEFLNSLPAIGDMPSSVLERIFSSFDTLFRQFMDMVTMILPQLLDWTSRFASSVINGILGIIISIYMLLNKEKFLAQSKKALHALFGPAEVSSILKVAATSHKIFSSFIGGKVLDSLIIGVLCFIGMTLFQMPYEILISMIVGVTNVIPYFGPFIGALPSILILLTVNPITALWFALFILALQQLDGNVIGPKILGQSTGLSAFWVIFSIMIFGGLFGFVGMFVGVPTFAVIYAGIKAFLEYKLKKRNLPAETQQYLSKK